MRNIAIYGNRYQDGYFGLLREFFLNHPLVAGNDIYQLLCFLKRIARKKTQMTCVDAENRNLPVSNPFRGTEKRAVSPDAYHALGVFGQTGCRIHAAGKVYSVLRKIIVVATPTGSTAYNLSAGGPILMPTLECSVISPIAPHSLTMRPLVVGGDSEIRLTTSSRVEYSRVSLDGRYFMMACGRDELRIRKAGFSVKVLRRPDASFSRLLRNKLLWGRR